MEISELNHQNEIILCGIFQERFEEITIPRLKETIEKYKYNIADCAAKLRKKGQLSYKGRLVKTKPDFKTICIHEGWHDLLKDSEVNIDA